MSVHPTRSGIARARRVTMAALALVAACAGPKEKRPGMAMDSSGMKAGPESTAQPGPPALTDAQIVDIALTADAIDSAAGRFALKQSRTKAVTDFARTMVNDHSAVNKQVSALAARLGVAPDTNVVSKSLQFAADQAHDSLAALHGAAFDRAYLDREIAYHEAVLDAMDTALIPGARNAELKQALTAVRPNFEAHLARARSVRQGLGG